MSFYRPHKRVITPTGTTSLTKQSFKDECDINRILSQYSKTSILSHINTRSAQYIDLPSNTDYQQSMNTILEAQRVFADLPAQVRDHFSNDPAKFLRSFSDEAQHPKLREFGLISSPPAASSHPSVVQQEISPTPTQSRPAPAVPATPSGS